MNVQHFSNTAQPIDRSQVQQQLAALGYQEGEKVYLRAFFPGSDPRKSKDRGRKAEATTVSELIEIAGQFQAQGRGIYFVVNGGGHSDKDVRQTRAVFYEHDNLDKATQAELWKSLGLPEPTLQIDTGGKSIHSYWVFDEFVAVENWRQIQTDLLNFADADRALKNPSRVMRLAGAWHSSGKQSRIIANSGNRYSYIQLREIIPEHHEPEPEIFNAQTNAYKITVPVPASVPLFACLAKESRLLQDGVSEGGRNVAGYQLACDLIGTANYLQSVGQSFDGDAESLLADFGNRCNPPLPAGELTGIWKSASKSNPEPACTFEGVDNCIKAWYWNNIVKPNELGFSGKIGDRRGGGGGGSGGGSGDDGGDGGDGGDRSNVLRFPGFKPLTPEQVTKQIDELIGQGATKSRLTTELNRLAAASQIYVGELRKLYQERSDESDIEAERDTNRSSVDNLLGLTDRSLALADYLPQSLSQPITQWCNWLNIRPAVALTALLGGISSVHKTGTELILQRNQNFRVPSTIYAALVSPSGQKKSPIFHNIIRRPLNALEAEKRENYQAAAEDYQTALQQWESTKKGEKPQEPKEPPIYYFTNATGEAIPIQVQKEPSRALLALIDELSGYFNSNNAYRGGRGSDKQDILSYFDGAGQTILRAGGVRANLKNIYLSIFGTIQPEILKRHLEDCSDPDGNWARFLFVNQPLEASILHDDNGMAVQISDRLTEFYRKIDRLPEMEYHLSRAAFLRYQPVYNELERLRVTHPRAGMRAVYSKMEGYIGRLALNLHVLWELDAGKLCPAPEIPLETMERAIELAKFYIGQVKLIHANADGDSLPTHIVKLIELSKRLAANGQSGWIKAQQYREQFQGGKRPTAQQARDWMLESVLLGHGQTRNAGNRLEYHFDNPNDGSDKSPTQNLGKLGILRDDLGMIHPEVQNHTEQRFEGNLGKLGMGIPNTQNIEVELQNTQNAVQLPSASEESFFLGERGSVPEASLTTSQNSCDLDLAKDTDLGNNLGNTIPNHPEVSLTAVERPISHDPPPNLKLTLGQNVKVSQSFPGRTQLRGKAAQIIKDLGEGLYQVKFEGAGVVVVGRGRVHTADIPSRFLELADSLDALAKPAPTGATPTKRIAPSNPVSAAPTSPVHSEPKPAPTTAENKNEATPSDEIDIEAEIADMVGMIRIALSSDSEDVEAVVAIVNEIIKVARNTVGISNNLIWERLTAQEQAAYIRALNTQSKPESEF